MVSAMALILRRAREADLERADELVSRSINDITQRHGFGPFATPSPPSFQAFSLRDDPEGLWAAEDGDALVGFAFSWVCGDLWFLAQLFVSPDHQSAGIGAELLKRTVAHADANGCAHRALITFTFNRVSQGLYMRHGLFPTVPIYFFACETERVRPRPSARLRLEPLENTPVPIREEIDRRAVGVPREKHHEYLKDDPNSDGFGLFSKTEYVGYVYLSKTGHIGPLAVAQDDLLRDAFEIVLALALDGGTNRVSAFLPGTAKSVMAAAVEHRMRITLPMVLMANDDFGQWTRYLPRNPGFM